MGLMKSLFGNRGAQQVAENKLVITEVGPNPAQVIAIAQNYFPEDPTGIATVLNDNILRRTVYYNYTSRDGESL